MTGLTQNLTFASKFLFFSSAAVRTYVLAKFLFFKLRELQLAPQVVLISSFCLALLRRRGRSSQPSSHKNFFAKAVLRKSCFLLVAIFLLSQPSLAQESCSNISSYYDQILTEVAKKNPLAISTLPDCFKSDRNLILKAVLLDPSQFQHAADSLQEDQVFIYRLLKISPEVLQYAAPEVCADRDFMEKATYINRAALRFAAWNLLDNKLFMKRMIEIDSFNYRFASDRIKEISEFAAIAFADNGLLLEFAPPKIKADKKLVKIAILSNNAALSLASDDLQKDKELQKLAVSKSSIKSPTDLEKFLRETYISGHITNWAKFSLDNVLIDRTYVTKWQRNLNFNRIDDGQASDDLRLMTVGSRNYQNSWKEDFKKYPDLVRKIEKFFRNHNLPDNTIDNLSTVFLWKVKSKPLTLAFNLYLLRDSTDEALGSDFANVTSLTAIVQKQKSGWKMTVVEVIFDSEERVDIAYEDGIRRYVLWDLYATDKTDKNPKIIFRVTDKFGEHLELFEEESGGKYRMVVN
ncbi:MAG: DUF4116 domain-containing protein [Alphaproteobacteria bacterium]|nr:DUF4116 domain-containing protein [Alphaproteobacteria bacterium]